MMWCGISSTSFTTLYPENSVKVNFLVLTGRMRQCVSSSIGCDSICRSIHHSHSILSYPLHLFIYSFPSISPFTDPSVHISLSPSINLSIHKSLFLYLSIHQSMYSYIFLPPFIHLYKIKTQNVEEEERRRRCETGRLRLIILHSCCIGFKFLYIRDDVEVIEVFKKERNCGGQG